MAGERIGADRQRLRRAPRAVRRRAEHRVGPVALGEPSVIVAASAPHRGEAFAGACEIIDRIKDEVPIWKVEVDADGAARRRRRERPLPVRSLAPPLG
jgi:molybdopterin synthase catalytic subunit